MDPSSTRGTALPQRPARPVASRVAVALAWLVVGLLGSVVAATVVVPRLAGAQTYTILTGSMEPVLSPGAVVVVRPVPVDDVGIGDVVTYQLRSGRDLTVTHRVVGLTVGPDGDKRLLTRGDAGGAVDAEPVRAVQLRGVVWYDVPHVGRVAASVGADARQVVSGAAAAALFGYAGLVLVRGRRDARRLGRRGPADDHDPAPDPAPAPARGGSS